MYTFSQEGMSTSETTEVRLINRAKSDSDDAKDATESMGMLSLDENQEASLLPSLSFPVSNFTTRYDTMGV